MLLNTGTQIVPSKAGLLTTVCYRMGGETIFALEGSIAVTGSAVQWLRDQLGIIASADGDRSARELGARQRRHLFRARRSRDCSRRTGGPTRAARSSGSRASTPRRTSRAPRSKRSASRRAPCSTRWSQDSGVRLEVLKVDGGATVNDTLMQLQADVLGVPVVRPVVAETTALGAAYAAGLAVGFWKDLDDLRDNWRMDKRGSRDGTRTSATRLTPGGKKQSSARSTGREDRRCWVLGARCWVLGAGCSVLGARCSVLGCSVLGARCWVLGAGCSVLGAVRRS